MTLKKYDSYKDSGIEWIGEIPNERKTSRGKFIGQHKKVISRGKVNNLLSLTMKGVLNKDYHGSSGLRPETYNTYQIFNKDDLVFKLIDLENFKTSRVGIVHEQGIMSPVYIRLELNKVSVAKYYYYYYYHLYITKVFNDLGTGVRSSLNAQDLLEIAAPVPSKLNQQAIAAYLDEKTETINKLIRKKKQQINLLEEKRTALINQAVTRGLDPDVELVDSGIEWIGKIPKGWEVRRIKTISDIKRGASPRPIDDQSYFDKDGEYGWVRIEDVSSSSKYLLKCKEYLSTSGKSKSVALEPGELFVSIAGSVGKQIITKIKCCIHDGFVALRKLKVSSEYLYYIFEGGELYKGLGKLGTQLNLNSTIVGNIWIPIPNDSEQLQIVEYLSKLDDDVSESIDNIQSSIVLLTEYKQSLISHVVTGKVKVT